MIHAAFTGEVGALTLDIAFSTGAGPLAVVGPNGAGKTTILLTILGLLRPRAGRITLGEQVLFDALSRVDMPVESRRLGYVPQDYALLPHLTVRDNLAFALGCAGPLARGADGVALERWLTEFQLEGLADRRPAHLSGGEKQRVALARALCVKPRALLLDEPLAALDVSARSEVRAFLARHLRGLNLPTIIVTHDPEDARAIATDVVVVEQGRVIQAGTWAALQTAPASEFVRTFARPEPTRS